MKLMLTAAFLAQNVIGSFCFMSMAHAAAEPAHEMKDKMEHMEMIMSPVVPMSPMHCENCVKVEDLHYEEPPAMQGMPCDTGHCLSHAPSPVSTIVAGTYQTHHATVPMSFVFQNPPVLLKGNPSLALAPPKSDLTRMVVLRL